MRSMPLQLLAVPNLMPHSVRGNKSTKADLIVKWSDWNFQLERNYILQISIDAFKMKGS